VRAAIAPAPAAKRALETFAQLAGDYLIVDLSGVTGIALTQTRDPGPGRDHYRRKIAEHEATEEARAAASSVDPGHLDRLVRTRPSKELAADERLPAADRGQVRGKVGGKLLIRRYGSSEQET
jgi:hypothetical protein